MAGNDDGSGWGKGLAAGLEIAAGVGLGAWAGDWWDKHHGSKPWGLYVGVMLGFFAGLYLLLRENYRQNKK